MACFILSGVPRVGSLWFVINYSLLTVKITPRTKILLTRNSSQKLQPFCFLFFLSAYVKRDGTLNTKFVVAI